MFTVSCAGSCLLQGLSSSCGEWVLLSSWVRGHLIVVASLAAEDGLWAMQALVIAFPGIYSTGSAVVVHGLSCPTACEILPDQSLNLCPLLPCTDRWVLNLWTSREVL